MKQDASNPINRMTNRILFVLVIYCFKTCLFQFVKYALKPEGTTIP